MLLSLLPDKLAHLLFKTFDAKETFLHQVEDLRQKYPDRPIAFALVGGGFMDFWAIQHFLKERFGEGFEPRTATRISPLLIDPPGLIMRRIASFFFLASKPRSRIRRCAEDLIEKRPILLNFQYTDRRKAFDIPQGEKDLAYLAQRVPHLMLVPTVFVWRKKRVNRQQPSDLSGRILRGLLTPLTFPRDFLLGDPMQPTALRKLAIVLRRYERSTIRLAEPIEIDSANVKMLRRRILTEIIHEKKVILGPVLPPPRFISESILRSPSFMQVVRAVAAEEETSEITLLNRSAKYFNEIAANYTYFAIEVFGWLLSWVFTRIFDDLTYDEDEVERLRLSSKEGPLLFIPCHKSYFDFLILSYMLFRKDIAPPHIAAGINLSFWPFGPFARKAGAFFIRRSFRGNVLYTEVLRRYIAALLQSRSNLEFFIEGARSRNGKLAPPKYGMLKMIVDSWYEGLIQEHVRVVPVSINYEKVTEVRSHKRELEGGEKVQESFLNLFKSTKVLFKRFGIVHVRFAESISMEQWLQQHVGETSSANAETRKLGVQKLAFEVCHRINRTTPVAGSGIVSAILMAKPGAAMPKAEFDIWLERMREDIERMHIPLNPSLKKDFIGGCHVALKSLIEDGIIEKYQTPSGREGLRVPQRQRIAAVYYKNSAIHAFLIAGVSGFAANSPDNLLEIRSLMQFEFFFSEKEIFLRNVLHVPEGVHREFYALMLDDVFENIALGLRALKDNRGGPAEVKEWRSRFMKYGKTAILESSLTRYEAVNTQSFGAFIDMAKNRKWLIPGAKEGTFVAASQDELSKALDKITEFRNRLPNWDALKAKYRVQPQE